MNAPCASPLSSFPAPATTVSPWVRAAAPALVPWTTPCPQCRLPTGQRTSECSSECVICYESFCGSRPLGTSPPLPACAPPQADPHAYARTPPATTALHTAQFTHLERVTPLFFVCSQNIPTIKFRTFLLARRKPRTHYPLLPIPTEPPPSAQPWAAPFPSLHISCNHTPCGLCVLHLLRHITFSRSFPVVPCVSSSFRFLK